LVVIKPTSSVFLGKKSLFYLLLQHPFRAIISPSFKFKSINSLPGVNKMPNEELPQYLTEHEVSKISRRAVSSLRNDRVRCRGLPYTKFGRSVRYNLKDVLKYMEDRKVVPEEI
jgi:hypothetical protein